MINTINNTINTIELFKLSLYSEDSNMVLTIDSDGYINDPKQHIIKGATMDYEPSSYGLGYEYFHCMKRNSNKIAQIIVDSNEIDYYHSFLQRSIRTALKMRSIGIQQDDIVSICSSNHLSTSTPFIASQFLGNRVASLDPALPSKEMSYLLCEVHPRILFVSPEVLPQVEAAIQDANITVKLVVFGTSSIYDTYDDFLVPHSGETAFQPVELDDNTRTAVIFFSSGTTGFPKGICVSHRGMLLQAVQGIKHWNAGNSCQLSNYQFTPSVVNPQQTVFLAYTSLYWISCVGIISRCIFGSEIRLVSKEFHPKSWLELVEKYNVTFAFAPPSQASDILEVITTPIRNTSLKVLLTGSAIVTMQLMEDLRRYFPETLILQAYGQTEMSGIITSFNTENPEDIREQLAKPLSCGKPLPGISYKVVDPDSEVILGPNQRGELRCKSQQEMNGYYNKDASSAYDSSGWLQTGDVVYYDDTHCFYIVDRIKEMFKYKSWHIVPAVLENILCKHPAVKEAVVVGVPHETDGDHPMGVVVLHGSYTVTEVELERFVEERVGEVQRLRAGVRIVDDIPKTCTGKIKRRTVRDMILVSTKNI